MPRRTYVELLVAQLRQMEKQQASSARLATLMGWDGDRVRQVATRARDEGVPIHIGKGGVIVYRGSENTRSVGLYGDVQRIIERYWGPRDAGLRNIKSVPTSRGGRRGAGVWTHPDLVIAADPARRSSRDEPRRLHAIEIETALGFNLVSVYQAHAQGLGANYSWVFGSKEPGVAKPDWDRIIRTAESIGVGVVTFGNSGAYGTWRTDVPARRQDPSPKDRQTFIDQVMNRAHQDELGI